MELMYKLKITLIYIYIDIYSKVIKKYIMHEQILQHIIFQVKKLKLYFKYHIII